MKGELRGIDEEGRHDIGTYDLSFSISGSQPSTGSSILAIWCFDRETASSGIEVPNDEARGIVVDLPPEVEAVTVEAHLVARASSARIRALGRRVGEEYRFAYCQDG